ncbi:tetratricopeptide repeat protein [bacterium]|nr:MAG: tetratricopeptide repeat protein [bacterium]
MAFFCDKCFRCGFQVALFSIFGFLLTGSTASAQSVDGQAFDTQASSYRLFMLGRHLEDEGELEAAIIAFRDAARLDREAAEPLAELSGLFARAGRADEAISTGEEALVRDSQNLTAHRILGLTYASSAGGSEGSSRDATRAISHLSQARGTLLPDLQIDLTLARLYLRTDAIDDATELLEQLVRDEPGVTEISLLLSQAYGQAGRHDIALETLETAVITGRPSYRALARLGEMYEQRRRWREAAGAYAQAVALNPRNATVRRRLARTLLEFGELDRARGVLEELIEMRPRDAASLHLSAEVELELNNFTEAESIARQLVELEPEGLRGPFILAQVHSRRREYQSVVDTLQPVVAEGRSRDIRPERLARSISLLGFAHEQLGNFQVAAQIYENAIEVMPNNLAFQTRLARAYVEVERYEDATRVLVDARRQHPGDVSLVLIEAEIHISRGNTDRSESLLQELVETNRDDPRGVLALASFYSEYDRVEDAVELLETAQQRFPEDNSIRFQLGAAFEQNDRFLDAERAFRDLLNRDPEHAPTLNYLGYMLADRGERLEESVTLIERAIAKDPHNGSYLDSLGWAYFKLNRFDLAESPLRAAGDQLQTNSVVQDHLGDLLNRLGQYDEAIEAWKRALSGDGNAINPDVIERKIDVAERQIKENP